MPDGEGEEPDVVVPGAFAGLYRFLEDGWRGSLVLSRTDGRRLTGRYRTDRDPRTYPVLAEVDASVPHKISIDVPGFNVESGQIFDGCLLGPSFNAIAGVTNVRGTPYSFFARRTRSLIYSSYRPGTAEPSDVAGTYTLHHGNRRGVLRLEHDGGRRLLGDYRPLGGGEQQPVTAEVGDGVPHAVRLAVDDAVLEGFLFTRPKNAVAGMGTRASSPLGFYMVKRADPAP